ncbi:hypothetical protein PInf_004127 [Phytophthora infestans]|nr:hypothetical protein PInf_004127 [Phytophthora infestans]
MDELKNKINDGFASLTSSTWTKAYTHAQKYETRYMELADQYELVSEDEGDDQDSWGSARGKGVMHMNVRDTTDEQAAATVQDPTGQVSHLPRSLGLTITTPPRAF